MLLAKSLLFQRNMYIKYMYFFCLKFFICNLAAWLLRGQSLIHSILAASSVAVVFGSELTTGRKKRNAVFADFSTPYYGGTYITIEAN